MKVWDFSGYDPMSTFPNDLIPQMHRNRDKQNGETVFLWQNQASMNHEPDMSHAAVWSA